MTDTPLYEATLADLLARARRDVEAARHAQEQARAEVSRAQHAAARQVAEAHARADAAVRAERARAEQAEEAVRQALADVPALPPLTGLDEEPGDAPPVPSLAELLAPSPGVDRFFDALLGPSGA